MDVAIIEVSGIQATTTWTRAIPSGIIGARILFRYTDPEWDNLVKNVFIRHGGTTRMIIDATNVVELPKELVEVPSAQPVWVGVYGVSPDGSTAIPTLWAPIGIVRNAADPSRDPTSDSGLPIWAQLLLRIEALEKSKDTEVDLNDFVRSVNGIAPDENGNVVVSGGGLTDELKTALINYYTHVMPNFDDANGLAYVNAILTALGAETRGEQEEPDTPVEPDEPDVPVVKTYTITNNLTNVSNSNSVASVEENASYSATLTADDGYELDSVTVTVGGTDITATAYASGVVTIGAVTGNVVITAVAVEGSAKVETVELTESTYSWVGASDRIYSDGGSTAFTGEIGSSECKMWYSDVFEKDTVVTVAVQYGIANAALRQYCGCISGGDTVSKTVPLYYFEQIGTAKNEEYTAQYTVRAGCRLAVVNYNAGRPSSLVVTK